MCKDKKTLLKVILVIIIAFVLCCVFVYLANYGYDVGWWDLPPQVNWTGVNIN